MWINGIRKLNKFAGVELFQIDDRNPHEATSLAIAGLKNHYNAIPL